MARYAVVILASGKADRFGAHVPKQYLPLFGETVLEHSIKSLWTLLSDESDLIIVYNSEHVRYIKGITLLYPKAHFIEGGAMRADSSLAAYRFVTESGVNYDGVFVHDAARPFPPLSMLEELRNAAASNDVAVPALPVVDTVKYIDGAPSPARSQLRRVQTPQYLSIDAVRAVLSMNYDGEFTDDASMAEAVGFSCFFTKGSDDAHKLTVFSDWSLLSRIFLSGARGQNIARSLVGHGYDVHSFMDNAEDDSGVTLCGVKVPYHKRLKGHSDADVALHAITDAIFGALSMRDIGYHFSDSDPAHKGRDSSFFVQYAFNFLRAAGYKADNVDITIICQRPVLFDYIPLMQKTVSAMLGGALTSIKATTTERLGFEGRGEGIACHATVNISSINMY